MKKKFKRLKVIPTGIKGCLNCGEMRQLLPMNELLGVGFGMVTVTKNTKIIYTEPNNPENEKDFWTTKEAENLACKEPNADWRIHFYAPLYEAHYQRQDKNAWMLYKRGNGFA